MSGTMHDVKNGDLLVQVTPSPLKPSLQEQTKEPMVFIHTAFWSQLSMLCTHSSVSGKAVTMYMYSKVH